MNFEPLGITAAEPVSGGCIHRCYRALRGGKPVFLKLNEARFADACAAEADGLAALRAAGCTAPEPISHGRADAGAFLLMEFLELSGSGDFAALGTMLAALHRKAADRFGWSRDNFIGATPQANGGCVGWGQFLVVRRPEPQLALARKNGIDLAAPEGWKIVGGRQHQGCLGHGELLNCHTGLGVGEAPC